jgi:hypothetical protein
LSAILRATVRASSSFICAFQDTLDAKGSVRIYLTVRIVLAA